LEDLVIGEGLADRQITKSSNPTLVNDKGARRTVRIDPIAGV